jgi:hypothetical protein
VSYGAPKHSGIDLRRKDMYLVSQLEHITQPPMDWLNEALEFFAYRHKLVSMHQDSSQCTGALHSVMPLCYAISGVASKLKSLVTKLF